MAWRHVRDRIGLIRRRALAELGPGERHVRLALDVGRLAVLQLRRNRAGMMAAALSYRFLFSLPPLLVIFAAVAKWSVSEATFLSTVHEFIVQLGLEQVQIGSGAQAGTNLDLGHWLEDLARQASSYDITGLTTIGLIVLVWAAYKLFDEIEGSLSVIASSGSNRRRHWQRLLVSLLVLVITPAAATWGLAILSELTSHLHEWSGSSLVWLADLGQWSLTILVIWGVVFLGYRYIPAANLSWRSVAIGALVATLVLIVGERVLRIVVVSSMRSSPVSASLGLVPVLMLWVYVMWIGVLYGMEVAVIIERARDRWRRLRAAGP